jgi:hypothetical protein
VSLFALAGCAGQARVSPPAGAQDAGGDKLEEGCDLPTGEWVALNTEGAPAVAGPLIVWTGRYLASFSATEGGVFDPCANRWRPAQTQGLPRHLPMYANDLNYPPLVAGDRIFFFYSGRYGVLSPYDSEIAAAAYDIKRDRWSALPLSGAPAPRSGATIAWTGREVIVWGGVVEKKRQDGSASAQLLNDGARLDPETGEWRPMSSLGAPSPRSNAAAVWTGSRLLVWGGVGKRSNPYQCGPYDTCEPTASGAMYDPETDSWTAISEAGAPKTLLWQRLLFTGSEAVLWPAAEPERTTALFDPAKNAWRPIPATPEAVGELEYSSGFVEGGKLVVTRSTTAVYDIARGRWREAPLLDGPHRDPQSPRSIPYQVRELIENNGRFIVVVTPPPAGSPPKTVYFVGRFNAGKERWERAVFPQGGAAPAPLGGDVFVWAGDRLLVFGQRESATQGAKATLGGGMIRPEFTR